VAGLFQVAGVDLLDQFADLLVQLADHVLDGGPDEAHLRGALGELSRPA
jgi:hypothetical protein